MKILFISSTIPYPLEKGGNPRTFEFLRTLGEKHDVYFISFIETEEEKAYLSILEKYCRYIETIPKRVHLGRYKFLLPLTALSALFSKYPYFIYKFRSKKMKARIQSLLKKYHFDIIHIDHLNMLQFVKGNNSHIKVLHHHNVESLSVKRYARITRNIFKRLYADIDYIKLKKYEAKMCCLVNKVLVVSEDDRDRLFLLTDGIACISVVHSGVDPECWKTPDRVYDREKISFLGRMDYISNIDGIKWFYKKVFPLLKRRLPNVKLFLIGSHPTKEIRLLGKDKNVVITGYIEDVRPYLAKSALSIIPLLYGGGVKIKTLIALSMGIPVVSTSIGCEGIKVINGKEILIADKPGLFANKIIEIMSDTKLRSNLSRNGRQLVLENYTCQNTRREITQIYQNYEH